MNNKTNKITIELLLPIEKDGADKLLLQQTEFLVNTWKDILLAYKRHDGIAVPTISFKRPKGTVSVDITDQYRKQFYKALIDHHLKYMPKDNVAAQMKAIKALHATGKTTEELIELYEQSRESYKLTSWHTVKYHLSKPVEDKKEPTFERKELNDEERADILNRLKENNE